MGLDEQRARACWTGILSSLDVARVSEDDSTYSATISSGDGVGRLYIMRTRKPETGCMIVLTKGAKSWDLSQLGEQDSARAARAVTHLILREGDEEEEPDKTTPDPPARKLPGDDPWGDPWIQGPPRVVDLPGLDHMKRM